jgi:hypothetical protein
LNSQPINILILYSRGTAIRYTPDNIEKNPRLSAGLKALLIFAGITLTVIILNSLASYPGSGGAGGLTLLFMIFFLAGSAGIATYFGSSRRSD